MLHSKGGGKGPRPERRTTLAYDYNREDLHEVAILASSRDELERYRRNCKDSGLSVYDELLWEGPEPTGSFVPIASGLRMSTPEFFAFRKSNQLDAVAASAIVAELMSNVRTSLTCRRVRAGEYEDLVKLDGPRMSARAYREYLEEVADTPEGARAIAILDMVTESGVVGDYERDVRENFEESVG